MNSLPTYEQARADTEAALQRVVDELPADTTVEKDDLSSVPECGDGYAFETKWTVIPPASVDTKAFVSSLLETLGDDFELEAESPVDSGAILMNAVGIGNAGVLVAPRVNEGVPFLHMVGTSRCAQAPAE